MILLGIFTIVAVLIGGLLFLSLVQTVGIFSKKAAALLFLFGLFFTTQAFSYPIEKVGQFQVSEYNEFLNKNIDKTVKVYVGVDSKGNERVQIDYDIGLTTIHSNFLVDSTAYKNFVMYIDKTIEWHDVAKQKGVDIERYFHNNSIMKSLNGCGTNLADCTAQFESFNNGKNAVMWLVLESTQNEFYDMTAQVSMSNVTLLKEILSNLVPLGLESRHANASKLTDADELFN